MEGQTLILNSKLWSGGAKHTEFVCSVARFVQRTGHRVNLFRNSNFLLGGIIQNRQGKGKTVLFSGFLFALLGTSGVHTEIQNSFSPAVDEEKEAKFSSCPKKTTLASLELSESLADGKESDKAVEVEEAETEECLAEKNVQSTLKEGMDLPQEKEGDIPALKEAKEREQKLYEKRVADLEKLLKGYPLAKMAPEIAKQDPEIAALIVGIARKESQWGVRSPKKNGDCFNYWGFKGAGGRGVGMGHACFATREEAVEKIANRLERLVAKRGTSKPSAMVVTWKCGASCATHSPESVRKWVSDVNQYYTKVLALK